VMHDIILVVGEEYFDHPLSGIAILKRWLEKHGFSVGLIEMPMRKEDIRKLGKPALFFGVSSGSIDSMVRNYTPLKKLRQDDRNLDYNQTVPDRAVIVYSNWIREFCKDRPIVLGGVEASLRRFVYYDYWDNDLRRPILFDSRGDILVYGPAEKQLLEIAQKLKRKESIIGIPGTCMLSTEVPEGFTLLPSYDEVKKSKERFCDMQNMFSNSDLAQKVDNRHVIQFKAPRYTSKDLDEYYGLPFTRIMPKHLRGFEFSVVTHRGCIGDCNFCSLKWMQGNRIISRSVGSILKEIAGLTKLTHFKGNVDDLGGPSANMYGMDCSGCEKGSCISCRKLDKSHKDLLTLMRKARSLPGIQKIHVRSGVRYDLAPPEYIKDLALHHIYDSLRIAPEHVDKKVLGLMNKDNDKLDSFISSFHKAKSGKSLKFYFMTAHPGSSMKEACELAKAVSKYANIESVQVFTPTPMTVSTCMYYTGLDPKTRKKVYVPYTYHEKKEQKRVIVKNQKSLNTRDSK
jgi:uncharacterized radical SAM protein YgiQ